MAIERIKKRNGAVVDFDRTRIETAMGKAFAATRVAAAREMLESMTDTVVSDLERIFLERIPGVEDVQDIVEHTLAARGHFDVAKAYILYRREHAALREHRKAQILDRVRRRDLSVKKRNGETARFDPREIETAIANCCRGHEPLADVEGILRDTELALYDGIPTSEINQAIIMAMRARIEVDPIHSRLAARLLLNDLYKQVIGVDEFDRRFDGVLRASFAEKIRAGVEGGRLDPRLLAYDFARLGAALRPERDTLLQYLGAQVLYDRYFLKNLDQRILETPQYFWMRIAMGLALAEAPSGGAGGGGATEGAGGPAGPSREDIAIEFYDAMSQLLYVPSTPTLFHAGTSHPQMSSCYITTVEDDLAHIMKAVADNAQLSKWSGGLGNDWTNIRATGALIKSTNVGSQGVVPFLKIVDATTAAINRSGKRRGATCVYLETWHYDIEDFLELRKNTGDERRRTHDTNTANWVPDLFMKRVIADAEWTLFSPDETPDLHRLYGKAFEKRYEEYERLAERGGIRLFRRVRAADLWRKMITLLFETGHPWITFKDPCNVRSPQDHAGVVHSSNLCTEIALNTSSRETAVCNLGSVNLSRHVRAARLDTALLAKTVETAVRMLDNVIDLNFYPTPEAREANLRHRPIGLGIMGLQDALYELELDFDSAAAVEFSDATQEIVSYHAILASSRLAAAKGAYESYEGSKWDRGIFPADTVALLEEERGLRTGVDRNARLDWTPVREHVARHGMRNSNTMAIAPTATIANIAGCFPSVEPIYKNIYVKSNFSGEFTIVNSRLVTELKRRGLWSGEFVEKLKYHDGSLQRIAEVPAELKSRFKEVFEIDPRWIVRHAAARGKWIDQSQSINIFTASTSGKFISEIYRYAWESGLKTTYYLRTLGASAIEKATLAAIPRREENVAPADGPAPLEPAECLLEDPTCEACQ